MSQSMHKACQKTMALDMPFDNKIPRFDMFLTCHLACILTYFFMTVVMLFDMSPDMTSDGHLARNQTCLLT